MAARGSPVRSYKTVKARYGCISEISEPGTRFMDKFYGSKEKRCERLYHIYVDVIRASGEYSSDAALVNAKMEDCPEMYHELKRKFENSEVAEVAGKSRGRMRRVNLKEEWTKNDDRLHMSVEERCSNLFRNYETILASSTSREGILVLGGHVKMLLVKFCPTEARTWEIVAKREPLMDRGWALSAMSRFRSRLSKKD